jgi:hypothetical protein
VPQGVPETQQANLYIKPGAHKHHFKKQTTTQYDSPVHVEEPKFTGSLNTYIICTPYVILVRTITPEFGPTMIGMNRLEEVEIFDFHMPRLGTFI